MVHSGKVLSPLTNEVAKTVYQAKGEAERNPFVVLSQRDDQTCEMFKIAKRMVKTNQDIIEAQCMRNNEVHWL